MVTVFSSWMVEEREIVMTWDQYLIFGSILCQTDNLWHVKHSFLSPFISFSGKNNRKWEFLDNYSPFCKTNIKLMYVCKTNMYMYGTKNCDDDTNSLALTKCGKTRDNVLSLDRYACLLKFRIFLLNFYHNNLHTRLNGVKTVTLFNTHTCESLSSSWHIWLLYFKTKQVPTYYIIITTAATLQTWRYFRSQERQAVPRECEWWNGNSLSVIIICLFCYSGKKEELRLYVIIMIFYFTAQKILIRVIRRLTQKFSNPFHFAYIVCVY